MYARERGAIRVKGEGGGEGKENGRHDETDIRHNWINSRDAALVPSQFNCSRCHTQPDLADAALPAKIENIAQRHSALYHPSILPLLLHSYTSSTHDLERCTYYFIINL